MAKRNLNEVLGFISRWGESEFSLRLLDEALSSAPLEAAAKKEEIRNPKGIRVRQLRARAGQREKREKSLLKVINDPATDPATAKKATDLLKKMKTSAKYDPELEGQKKDPTTGEVTIGGKKPEVIDQKKQMRDQIATLREPTAIERTAGVLGTLGHVRGGIDSLVGGFARGDVVGGATDLANVTANIQRYGVTGAGGRQGALQRAIDEYEKRYGKRLRMGLTRSHLTPSDLIKLLTKTP